MPNHTLEEVVLSANSVRSPYYFNGRLLTAEDLWSEHDASLAREQGLGRAVGSGVIAGLELVVPDPRTTDPLVVALTRGLAVNRCGQIVQLCEDITLALERPSRPNRSTTTRDFARCAPPGPGTAPSREGAYLLTIAPARRKEGRAPVTGLGSGIATCNAGRLASGVQFRLVEITGHGLAHGPRIRSQLAWFCLGLPIERPTEFARLPDGSSAPPVDPLRHPTATFRLADSEVPLALLYWSNPSTFDFADVWAVRRRPVPPDHATGLGFLAGAVRSAEIEAAVLQFDAHLRAILSEPGSHASLAASSRFQFLPPAGFLPVGADRPAAATFFGPHASGEVIPLSPASVRSVLRAALAREPWRVLTGPEAAANPATVTPVHLFEVPSLPGHRLFARSAHGESTAADIHFDNRRCQLPNVGTVQQALDTLCRQQRNCCTLTVTPEPGWESVFDRIAPFQDAEICFQAGTYPLAQRRIVADKGHLRIVGAGPASRLVASQSETTLHFQGCRSVRVESLHAESTLASSSTGETTGLAGVLTFANCPDVDLSGLSFRCASGPFRAVAGLVVRHDTTSGDAALRTSVRVRHSQFEVGHEQVGILVINTARTHLEDNILRAGPPITLATALASGELRGRLRQHFIDNAVAGPLPDTAPRPVNARVTFNGHLVRFLSAPELDTTTWQTLINTLNPSGITSPDILLRYLRRLIDLFIRTAGFGTSSPPTAPFLALRTALLGQILPSMSQGLVVAGRLAAEVRIVNNSISGAQQGIHVGVSHREGARGSPDLAGTVAIQGNSIGAVLPTTATRERHGAFVGNCRNLLVENNQLELRRAPRMANYRAEGLRIFGYLERRAVIRANQFAGFSVGIRFEPRRPFLAPPRLWLLENNVAPGATPTIQLTSGMPPNQVGLRLTDNFP